MVNKTFIYISFFGIIGGSVITDRKVTGIMNYGKKGVKSKQKALNSKSVKWGRKFTLTFLKVFLIAIIALGICGVAVGIGMFKGILDSTPDVSVEDLIPKGESTLIYDREGNEIDKYVSRNANRIIVDSMDAVPKNLSNAFVAIEDKRFYEHNGIDIKGLFRAGYQFLITGGDEAQGASTITQQLLKNTIFTDWTSEGDNMIKKIKRKVQEQYLALEITKKTTKDQVLLQYMNTINLGQNTLGIQAASQRYFGKPVSELSLSECTVIACITQNPSKYNPIRNSEKNAERRKTCLDEMLDLEFISKAEYDEALADTDAVYDRIGLYNEDLLASNTSAGSYFSDALQKQVLKDMIDAGYNETQATNLLLSGGLRIHSTLDPKIQLILDEEVANAAHYPENVKWYLNYAMTVTDAEGKQSNYSKEMMMTYFQENVDKKFNLIFSSQEAAQEAIDTYKAAVVKEGDSVEETISMTPQPQVSVSLIDQTTGYVLALVGGRGTKDARLTLNRATDSTRPPGSTFKILAAYAPALDSAGLTLASVFEDKPFSYEDGRAVKNWYSTGYRGINSIRKAIEQSMNIIAVKTLTQITPQLGYDYLLNFGFTTLTSGKEINGQIFTDIQQPLALGGITTGVTNVELNAAYAAIANGGMYIAPKLYTKVISSDGTIILDNTSPASRQVIKETTAYLLTDAMVDVVTKGTGASVNFGNMALAGKTGTTTSSRDVWFSGYTPYYTCTTWAGYDNNLALSSSSKNNEAGVAKKLWRAVMSRVHEGLPNEKFSIPSGIVQSPVCNQSGKLPIPGLCDGTITMEYFAEGTVPTENCNIHYQGAICGYDHLPATEECPFRIEGIMNLPLIEDASLQSGSSNIVTNPDGTQSTQNPAASNKCQHGPAFFADPNFEAVISQQQFEINQRVAAQNPPPADTPAEQSEDQPQG